MKTIPQISVDAQVLGKFLCTLKMGQEIGYDELNKIVPGRKLQNGDNYVLQTARRYALRESSVVVEIIRGKGIKRLTDAEIAQLATPAIRRIRHTSKRASGKVVCADYEKLSADDKTAFNSGLSVLGTLHHFTSEKAQRIISESAAKALTRLPLDQTLKLFAK